MINKHKGRDFYLGLFNWEISFK